MEAYDNSIRKGCGKYTHSERAMLGGHNAPKTKFELVRGARKMMQNDDLLIAQYGQDIVRDTTRGYSKLTFRLRRDNATSLNPFDKPNWEDLGLKDRMYDEASRDAYKLAKVIVRAPVGRILSRVEKRFTPTDQTTDPLLQEIQILREDKRRGIEIDDTRLIELQKQAQDVIRRRDRDYQLLIDDGNKHIDDELKAVEQKAIAEGDREKAQEARDLLADRVKTFEKFKIRDIDEAYKFAIQKEYGEVDTEERREALREDGLVAPSMFRGLSRQKKFELMQKYERDEFGGSVGDFITRVLEAREREIREIEEYREEQERKNPDFEDEYESESEFEEEFEEEEVEEEVREQAPRRRPVEEDVDDVVDELVEETVKSEGRMRMRDVENPFIDDTSFYEQDIFDSN